MAANVVNSFASSGVDGFLVKVEVQSLYGQPAINIIGLGDRAIREAGERIRAAIIESAYKLTKKKVIINLAPSDIQKRGTHFDLPMAIGLLVHTNQVFPDLLSQYGFIGELSLTGELRACSGVLPMVVAAKENGIFKIIVPKDNLEEASLIDGVTAFGFESLREVIAYIERKNTSSAVVMKKEEEQEVLIDLNFSDVIGHQEIMKYIVVAAAGGHNMLMVGPPGSGKSMLAKRIPSILPPMSNDEAVEVTKIYSVAGELLSKDKLIRTRPFRSPHHSATINSIVGGGTYALPGEISLAHNGVLFLDEIPEFGKKTLDALRQPLEDGHITVSRVNTTNRYPSNFMLVGAMNPCPCGHYGSNKCKCTDYEIFRYQNKLSGPIMDRIDIQKRVDQVDLYEDKASVINTSEGMREQVVKARLIQRERFRETGVYSNAEMTQVMIKEYCVFESEAEALLRRFYQRQQCSGRTYHRICKISRTFADLDASKKIRSKDVLSAISARDIDMINRKLHVVV